MPDSPAPLLLSARHCFPHQPYPLPGTHVPHIAPLHHTAQPWQLPLSPAAGGWPGVGEVAPSEGKKGGSEVCGRNENSFYPLSRLQWGFQTIHLLVPYCCVLLAPRTRVKNASQGPARMWRRFNWPSVIKEVRYDSLGWTLLLLGLSRSRMATLASAVLRAGRAGTGPGSFGKGCSGPSSLLRLLSHRSGKGHPGPMFLGLFNHRPYHSLCAQPWRLCPVASRERWGIGEEQGGKPTPGGMSRAGKEEGKSQSPGVAQETPQGARNITVSPKRTEEGV